MLRNYFLIAWRNLKKNKVFSLINLLGLAVGMAACLLILQYVSFELSYDDFRRSNIHRVVDAFSTLNGEVTSQRAQTTPAIAPAMRRDLPEVIRAARVVHTGPLMSDPVLQVGDRSFHEERIYFADSSFLNLFSYQLTQGDVNRALAQPNSVVLSQRMADKYFPGQDPLHQTMTFYQGERGPLALQVTGVFADLPAATHLHTDVLVSFNSIPFNLDEVWDWGNFYNYVELAPGTDPAAMEAKLATFLERYLGDWLAQLRAEGSRYQLVLQPIQTIHLDSDLQAEAEANGSRRAVEFLVVIALFILVIAWINYLNLTTAKSAERAREISIRKAVGSSRRQLMGQFLAESVLVNLGAAALALTLSQLLLPWFSTLVGSPLATTFQPWVGWATVGLFLVGAFCSGFYPAFVLSAYPPLRGLKSRSVTSPQGVHTRKVLVVFQFAASIALIAGTLAVQRQLQYMQEQDLGLQLDQTLVVKGPGIKDSTYQHHLTYFKQEAARLPSVQRVAVSSSVPGQRVSWGRGFYRPNQPDARQSVHIIAIDEDFFDLYGAKLAAGRNFSEEITSDREAVIFNEEAIRLLGFPDAESAIGQSVVWDESGNQHLEKQIVGVVKDFHQQSLHQAVGPIVFALKRYLNAPWAGEYYSFKLKTDRLPATLDQLQTTWAQAFQESPFDAFFLDDFFNAQYQADQQFGRVFGLFAGLAIFIACLGLFGLSSYTLLQRTKEIGIRKVLGAEVPGLVRLLAQDFIRLVLIASVLAIPLVYLGIRQWLTHYAYRTDISWPLLALPVGVVLLIAVCTISFQTVKAAFSNPVEALRSE
ncbi:putative ABC transport system permease protein [Catalinimonas alkaloidigena]|uniref:Putative ABC transport system permease protein n=1 Tax=Catalinimonas alkaloidigena TaxID=1075417 RepID=A0A1G9FCY8_9BACT|nr:ABC transporter permease [Catalinimonas alkaloidigena]SDK86063.1 putative ABC transport system permease protein [Catalinimonas alkaloidigena]